MATKIEDRHAFLGKLSKTKMAQHLTGLTVSAVRKTKTHVNFELEGDKDTDGGLYLSVPRSGFAVGRVVYRLKTAKQRKAEGLPPLKWNKW